MTNDPDFALKSHGPMARDPASWLRWGGAAGGQKDLAGAVLHTADRHIPAHSLRAIHTVSHQQTLPKILSSATSLPLA